MVEHAAFSQGLLHASARAQARAVAAGRVSADSLLQCQLDAVRSRNPQLNAYIAQPATPALESGTSPLAGSSFAAKDNFDVAGLPTASGLRAMSRIAMRDAPVVARLRGAGLACLGKLNMHAMALGATNHNPDFGDCFNPRRAGFTPGGSSGGSGAAVAAGLCGIALGTDTMGSVRVPAAYCGVVGFKPSHETLGLEGVQTLCRWLDHAGLLARSVEDIEAAMRICAPHLGAMDPPAVSDLRLGVVQDLAALGADVEVAAAFDAALARLRQVFGCTLQAVRLDQLDLGATRRAGLLLCEAELHPVLAPVLLERPDVLPADLLAMMRHVERKSAPDLGLALERAARTGEELDRLTQDLDALLLPTTPQQAFPMRSPVPRNQADFTALANMNGAPAISLPLPVTADALPVGLQLIGRRGHDLALLQLAARVESALSGP
ncbi:MAG: amidase [Rhodoferax sp.]|nr:amidase [Rhodoferax sp.]MCW5644507.1 amidase [Rhodoferax sp.]